MDVAKLVQYARNDAARKQRDVPKRDRPRRVIEPAKPFSDPQLLGHPPRPRKRKARR